MEQVAGGVAVGSLVDLTAMVDKLASVFAGELAAVSDADVVASLHELETARRRLAALDHALLGQLSARSIPTVAGFPSTSTFLQAAVRLSPGEASGRVRAAELVGERRTVTGTPLEPLLPVVAEAQAEGRISVEHVSVIVKVVNAFPDETTVQQLEVAEQQLVSVACQARPGEVAKLGQRILAWLDPDGADDRARGQQKRRDLTLTQREDGMTSLRGVLTPACAAQLVAALTPRSAPRPADGARDPRSHGQRLHDALEELAGTVVRRNELTESGAPATVIITMTDQQYSTGHGVVETSSGQQLTVAQALKLADEAILVALTQTLTGEVLNLGRTKRIASRAQTLALIARDKGCSFPDCDKPPEMTQRHHVIEWWRGGATDLDNLTLLCGYHHREFDNLGWRCEIRDGLPEWTPPRWIDPAQTPRTNTRISADRMIRQ